jgi:thiol-disulfide isomerase/thioredoxin
MHGGESVVGGEAVRVRACLILMIAGLIPVGCSGPPKRPAPSSRRAAERDEAAPPDNLEARPAGSPAVQGLLAGQVLDKFNRKVPKASIQVVELGSSGPAGAPFEVEANKEGDFTIKGLDPSAAYRLIARVKDGDQLQACTVEVRPPNPRVVIFVSEDNVNASTPPIPAMPIYPGRDGPKKDAAKKDPKPPVAFDKPIPGPAPIIVPKTETPPEPPATGGDNKTPADPATTDPPRERRPDMRIDIPSPPRRTPVLAVPSIPRDVVPPPPAASTEPYSGQPLPVPACVMLTARQLDNFALQDLNGKPWEFRRDRKGRLVLLDFWHTKCPHCMPAIRHLNELQQAYASRGLEVVSVACEAGDTAQRERQVMAVRNRFDIRYRILMWGEQGPLRPCPVCAQLSIAAYPTLKLIDEKGRIVWESMGLTDRQLYELKMEIERRLPLTR